MSRSGFHKAVLAGSVCSVALMGGASARNFIIPGGDLEAALTAFSTQSGVGLIVSDDDVKGIRTKGVSGDMSDDAALARLLAGTGFVVHRHPSGKVGIARGEQSLNNTVHADFSMQLAQAAPPPRAVETVTVTSSKLGGADVQSIPIAITALSQEQLTASQTAGGPDLVKQVPNLTFTKTNFTGYSIQIRGIGTQAISVTTDPAVAVAFNDMPFIRNHFFEQEFYDVSQVEVLRGPQGTLYGRNATAGVVNLVSARPTDQFEALASADIGNYKNRRFEGMVNLPIVDDRLAVRIAGEWTKRNGYTTNGLTGNQVDGRDLWSSRVTIGWKPLENVQTYLIWEHFSEDDDRMRTAKQLCKTDPGVNNVLGVDVPEPQLGGSGVGQAFKITTASLSQGCLPASLYADESFGVPYGFSLPYVVAGWVSGGMAVKNPYAGTRQSTDLRLIETAIDPRYKAKNDTVELNVDVAVTPGLTVTSQTGYNQDFLWSTEDYNRFNTSAGMFQQPTGTGARAQSLITANGEFCDPQLGCSSRLIAQDISRERAWQLNQEIRLASKFSGPLNFSVGGNYMHYETEEDYFVFANTLTMLAVTSGMNALASPWDPGVTDNHTSLNGNCVLRSGGFYPQYNEPGQGAGQPTSSCYYIDPNPLGSVNAKGHNYFLSQNPYSLNSYAAFGETYYQLAKDIKLTGGLRWTDDQKHFTLIPSELLANGYGYADMGPVDQEWKKFTGRFAANWTPELDFTDQTLVYASYARGYKAGGANPPGAVLYSYGGQKQTGVPVHPLTFEPEYVHAFELGSKNTLLDGAVTLNGNVFYYDYKGYQISEIVDRTSINLNFDATVKGAELEATYEPVPGLRFRFAGGYEKTRIADGAQSIDLMDRTAGHSDWLVYKPFVTLPSNCIFPAEVVKAMLLKYWNTGQGNPGVSACGNAYFENLDPVTLAHYYPAWEGAADPAKNLVPGQPYYSITSGTITTTKGYPFNFTGPGGVPMQFDGFDPSTAPNGGTGFAKDLGGNELPNAPPLTVSFSAEYTLPLSADWAGTLRGDYYWQDYSWARVFNDRPYDRIRGYTNVNLALILTSQDGWQVMGYLKNVFDTTAITGAFLNSDDSGLTTNVFLTDPRLFGMRVTKNW
jgi:outer membrane receptor protein involved in Fe transport